MVRRRSTYREMGKYVCIAGLVCKGKERGMVNGRKGKKKTLLLLLLFFNGVSLFSDIFFRYISFYIQFCKSFFILSIIYIYFSN